MINFAQFQRPQHYIGNEWNVIKKAHAGKISICLGYPDNYSVGMSNLGLRIIYGMLNEFPDVVCERTFLPGKDLATFLNTHKIPLFSLETKTPLNKFSVIGFNLSYELNCINFLQMLSLGGVAINAVDRHDIIVIGGGIANPEPFAQFVDIFCIGEFEAVAAQFVDILRKYPEKQSRLEALSEINGFYVPKFYSVYFDMNRYHFEKLHDYAQFPVKKVHVLNLNDTYYPIQWLTPHTSIIHDRAQIELARGCPNACTFCQARSFYYPYRERNINSVKTLLQNIYKASGYENFSFLSLSASNYSKIEELVDEIMEYSQLNKLGIALPSLRIDDIIGRLYKKLFLLKKTSLTVAIEAVRESLREGLNKKIEIQKLFDAAQIIKSLRVKHIKAYFMIGFPEENDDDIRAIGEFLRLFTEKTHLAINASINMFIPKAFSIWESTKMDDELVLKQKRVLLFESVPRRHNINISVSSTAQSIVEAVLSRADRNFSNVIYKVYTKMPFGIEFRDGNYWDIWKTTMEELKVDYRFFLDGSTENFPWSFIELSR